MGNIEQKKRNKDYSFGSAVESVLSLLRAVKTTPASKRPADKYPKGRAEKLSDKHRRSRFPRRSLSELPEDLQEAFRLKKWLEKLEQENGYISAGTWQGLLQTGQKELQDLQVLREKQMLDLYCQKNGLHSARRVEEVLDLCGFTGKKHAELIAAEELNQQGGDYTAREKPGHQGSDSAAADGLRKGAPDSKGEASGEANSEISGAGSGQPAWVRAHNARYLERALEEERDYLDHVLDAVDPQIRLDQAQRRMVLTDEDNCLVIAGAGAGKTTSVAAKVKYLVDRKGVKPEEILVISFTNKAVEELRARIQRDLGIPCPICTFHSAGNAVLHMQNPERVNIVDADKKFFVVRDYLRGKILQDPRLVHSLILFFASYFDAPLDEKNLEAFFRGIAQMRYTTMRSELDEYCAEIMDAQRKKKITIRNEVLRSAQEVEIANFLYRNGIDYVYEPVYRYHIEMARKPYTPDFMIRQGDREIYIEHFGITRDGRNSRYDEKRLRAYKDAVNEKVLLHRRHGTELIYTFSGYGDGRSLTEHLEEELRTHGVIFHPRSDEEILRKILQNEGNRYIRRLVMLICRFITNFKTDGYTEMQFAVMKESTQNVRTKLFLEICQACYLEYQKALQEIQAVDFEDMINDSARALRECAEMKQRLGFKYIIVDEYQDISRQRFDLTKALREVCDAKVIAVGDDWQSIYAFSGSDITLFTQFQEKMGPAAMLRIENTYRNAQELIDIAGSFVQKNPAQITKTLHSAKRIEDPVIIYSYDASYKRYGMDSRSGANYNRGRAIEAALDHIVESRGLRTQEAAQEDVPARKSDSGKTKADPVRVLILGRYNFDGYKLEQTDLFTYRGKGKGRRIVSKKYPELQITFMTAHASKGLGYDEVIVINGQGGTYGFPSKIEDDPVLSLVLREDRSYAYAEERRLFYVAMTRTKNRVYFIAPLQEPSEFLLELLHDYKNVRLDDSTDLVGEEPDGKERFLHQTETGFAMDRKKCPLCGYPLQLRYKAAYGLRLYLCTNDSEICGFMTNDLRGGRMSILKCDRCADGYLIVRTRRKTGEAFLGCTNFTRDGKGCGRTMGWPEYQQKMKYEPGYRNM